MQMCGAVVTYLAFRRDEVTDVREDILRLAARAEFDGSPPQLVADWLESEGVGRVLGGFEARLVAELAQDSGRCRPDRDDPRPIECPGGGMEGSGGRAG